MLRASVSLSRKISRDFNSTGYTVTLDGEIPYPPSDSEGVAEKIGERVRGARAVMGEVPRDNDDSQWSVAHRVGHGSVTPWRNRRRRGSWHSSRPRPGTR